MTISHTDHVAVNISMCWVVRTMGGGGGGGGDLVSCMLGCVCREVKEMGPFIDNK